MDNDISTAIDTIAHLLSPLVFDASTRDGDNLIEIRHLRNSNGETLGIAPFQIERRIFSNHLLLRRRVAAIRNPLHNDRGVVFNEQVE